MKAGSKVWASLSLYESVELVKRFIEGRTDEEFDADRARDIAADFSQGREYFRSAAGASELVRPLILYYGAVALARGTILFLDPDSSGLAPVHGLSAVDWEALNTSPETVPDLPVKIQKAGTFPELWRATGNSEWFQINGTGPSEMVGANSPGSDLIPTTVLTVKDVLGQVADISGLYERTFAEHSRRLRCEPQATGISEHWQVHHRQDVPDDQETSLLAHLAVVRTPLGLPPKELVPQKLPGGRLEYKGEQGYINFAREHVHRFAPNHYYHLYYEVGSHDKPRLDMPLVNGASGEEYLKLPTDSGVVLSTLLSLHLIAFAVGTLVRPSRLLGDAYGKDEGRRDRTDPFGRNVRCRGTIPGSDSGADRRLSAKGLSLRCYLTSEVS